MLSTETMESAVSNIQTQLRNYIRENDIKALVIGVSGGIDSALCCALAHTVCRQEGIFLIGRSLPIITNKKDELDRARKVGSVFCTDFKEVDLSHTFTHLKYDLEAQEVDTIESDVVTKIRHGNIKARIRMIYLYNIAQQYNGMVLSTDNFTEYLLGFWTLHGDVGDYGMIQKLWKTEVYDLSSYLASVFVNGKAFSKRAEALTEAINCDATDGLGISDNDLSQLEATSYEQVDKILKTWLTEDEDSYMYDDMLEYDGRPDEYVDFQELKESYENHPVVKRFERTHFKRNNPTNISRMNIIL